MNFGRIATEGESATSLAADGSKPRWYRTDMGVGAAASSRIRAEPARAMLYNRQMSSGFHLFRRIGPTVAAAPRHLRATLRTWSAALLLAVATIVAPLAGGEAQSQAIVVVGDSISAGYGLTQGTGWVA